MKMLKMKAVPMVHGTVHRHTFTTPYGQTVRMVSKPQRDDQDDVVPHRFEVCKPRRRGPDKIVYIEGPHNMFPWYKRAWEEAAKIHTYRQAA